MSTPSPTRPISVSLSPDLSRRVRSVVEAGVYPSANDVVRDALRLFLRVLDERSHKLDALRAALRPALDQLDRGEGDTFSLDEFLAWADQRLRDEGRPGLARDSFDDRDP